VCVRSHPRSAYSVSAHVASAGANTTAAAYPKYVFFFLADGAGAAHMEIARQYSRKVHNAGFTIVDKIIKEGQVGVMTTDAADFLSTDSAAAATAIAGGCKANIGALGVCADGTPALTAMELARRGSALGPSPTRSSSTTPVPPPSSPRAQPPRLRAIVVAAPWSWSRMADGRQGISFTEEPDWQPVPMKPIWSLHSRRKATDICRAQELKGSWRQKRWGFQCARHELSWTIRTTNRLSMTARAAIRLLHDRNPNGFFAFIESENIDSASHLSDIASVIQDYREFDRAVGLAYEFYRKYPRDTLIIATSDHETGGLGFTLALKDLTSINGDNRAAGTVADFKKIQSIGISLRKASEILGRNPSPAAVDKLVKDHFPGFTLAPEYKEAIVKRQPISRTLFTDPTTHALGMMVANHTQAYWQTSGHTNQPVLVAAIGVGAEHFRGYYDNADFGKQLKAVIEGKPSR
jgi:alkaline phosphatase